MYVFETPTGRAGWDQVYGMMESVHAELEQMFWQVAKLDGLSLGVGRTVHVDSTADSKVRLDSQMRECQAQITFHAGCALELAMNIVYACGADRIMGRDYPGMESKELRKDRRNHNLSWLYQRIQDELKDRNMCKAFEEVYQEALHKGVTDLYLDDELYGSYLLGDDQPFIVHNKRSVIDGAEMTLDHADWGLSLSSGVKEMFQFEKLPLQTFSEFLEKADAVYYRDDTKGKRGNMRLAHYSARDHEYGRPYVVAGTKFFARLVKGVVDLSNQQWTWHPDFRLRWHHRRQCTIDSLVRAHFEQSYQGDAEPPEMKPIEQMETLFQWGRDGKRFRQPQAYKNLHGKLLLQSTRRGAASNLAKS